jgi:TPR repeat protein
MSGFGVVQDPKAGLRWIEQAASEGHIEAMYDLYQYHVNRPGGEKDALQWIRRAADAGSGDARFRIALLHRDGNLLPQSDDEMMRWLGSAAEAGHEYSVELLGRVKRVGSADILKPHALVQEEK